MSNAAGFLDFARNDIYEMAPELPLSGSN